MANFATLKAAINAVIRANGNKEITGTVLNETLTAMVNSLGANYQFAGVAIPSTNPGTPDQNVFWLAGCGIYENFGSQVRVPFGYIGVFTYNGTFTKTILPTSGVLDISVLSANSETGVPTEYASLANALVAVPSAYQRGGMEVQYIDSTTHKYVKYRLMAASWSTTVSDWQGVDDEPTAGSENLVKSGGVFNAVIDVTGTSVYKDDLKTGIFYNAEAGIGNQVSIGTHSDASCIMLPIREGEILHVTSQGNSVAPPVVFISNDNTILDIPSTISIDRECCAPTDSAFVCINLFPTTGYTSFNVSIDGVKKDLGKAISNITELQSKINFFELIESNLNAGTFYGVVNGVGNTISIGHSVLAASIKIPIEAGCPIYLSSRGNSIAPPLIFVDKDNKILSIPDKPTSEVPVEYEKFCIAPANTSFVCVNLYENNYNFFVLCYGIGNNGYSVEFLTQSILDNGIFKKNLTKGFFWRGDTSEIGNVVKMGTVTNASFAIIPVKVGEQIYVKGKGNSIAPPLIFIDSNYQVLSMPLKPTTETSVVVEGTCQAPENSAYLCINLFPNDYNDFVICSINSQNYPNVTWTLPRKVYAINGLEKSIYLANVVNVNDEAPDYVVEVYREFGNVDGRRFYFTPSVTENKAISLNAYNRKNKKIGNHVVDIEVLNNELLAAKRLCCIGDSITEKENMPYYIQQCLLNTLTAGSVQPEFVGTKGGTSGMGGKPTKHEGWWGRSYQWLATDNDSPFINPNTGLLDISYYRENRLGLQSNEYIDVVSLAMGFNGTYTTDDADASFSALQSIIAAFKADNASTKFVIHLVTYPAMGNVLWEEYEEKVPKKNSLYYFRKKCLDAYNDGQDANIIIGDLGLGYDRWYAYPRISEHPASFYQDDTLEVVTDRVHPTIEGTNQMANNIAPVILKMLCQ